MMGQHGFISWADDDKECDTETLRYKLVGRKHPAPFSPAVLDEIERLLDVWNIHGKILDPFAGIGRVHLLASNTRKTVGIEIEPEWAHQHPDTRVGNALALHLFPQVCRKRCHGCRFPTSEISSLYYTQTA